MTDLGKARGIVESPLSRSAHELRCFHPVLYLCRCPSCSVAVNYRYFCGARTAHFTTITLGRRSQSNSIFCCRSSGLLVRIRNKYRGVTLSCGYRRRNRRGKFVGISCNTIPGEKTVSYCSTERNYQQGVCVDIYRETWAAR